MKFEKDKGAFRLCLRRYWLEFCHPTVTHSKGRRVWGAWANTIFVFRKDADFQYRWAIAFEVLGFGLGLVRMPHRVKPYSSYKNLSVGDFEQEPRHEWD